MEHAHQIVLLLVIWHYTKHAMAKMREAIATFFREISTCEDKFSHARRVVYCSLTLSLNSCIDASPAIFYGIHLTSQVSG